MGLGRDDNAMVDDGDDDDMVNPFVEEKLSGSLPCSICLDVVALNGGRSWAKLQCGHHFHLDCIGSAFNAKGSMQCPNCRKIEKGQWLYGNGGHTLPEITMEEWFNDDDIPDLSYAETAFGAHWCPYGSLNGHHPSFDSFFSEREFTHAAYHDVPGQHAALSSVSQPCPYIAYVGVMHHPFSNSHVSISEGSSFSTHWNGPPPLREIPSYGFPTVDPHYQGWEQHSSPFFLSNNHASGAEQASVRPVSQMSARFSPDVRGPRTMMNPYFLNHSPGSRGGSLSTSSMVPPYPGSNARALDRAYALQAYLQSDSNARSNYHRAGLAQGASPTAADPSSGPFVVRSGASSGQNFQGDSGHPLSARSTPEPDGNFSFSFLMNDGESDSRWGTSAGAGVVSNSGIRSGSYGQRQGWERMS